METEGIFGKFEVNTKQPQSTAMGVPY
jgi:hypothetical protein